MTRLRRFLRVVPAQEKDEGRHAEGGYLSAEPPMDGIAQEFPEGTTVVQEGGKMYFQFDTVFLE